jgi:hypothetical protein
MQVKITVNLGEIRFDKQFTGSNEEHLFRQFRTEAQSRLGFLKRKAAEMLDDRAFIRKVVETHNSLTASNEPIPTDVAGFFAFGRHVGYVA